MPGTATQSSLSTQYLQVPVSILSPSGYDPTEDSIAFAFTLETYPETMPVTWHDGSWVTYPGPVYVAQCLIGPQNGGVVLGLGLYQIWLKITDNPEVPVLQQAYLQIVP